MRKKVIELSMGILMVAIAAVLFNYYGKSMDLQTQDEKNVYEVYQEENEQAAAIHNQQNTENTEDMCVVLDAGHGGDDPGKIGVNNALEKDINLAMVYRLKANLEASDVRVILTRETDDGLYETAASNKKMNDMNKRCEIIQNTNPDLVVSIHQNSYHEGGVQGPQVFYYKTSENGKRAAELIQKRFDTVIGAENNTRIAKANDNYYLLLHTEVPIIICECGFLSNWEEAEKLVTADYQEKMCWTIFMGIMQYLNGE